MEQRKIPAAGEFYRHFKGRLYQIVGIATHSETEEKMVVYQALYGEYGLYVRPLEEFMSLVDRTKYPDALQHYRFEQTVPEEAVKGYDGGRTIEEALKVSNGHMTQENIRDCCDSRKTDSRENSSQGNDGLEDGNREDGGWGECSQENGSRKAGSRENGGFGNIYQDGDKQNGDSQDSNGSETEEEGGEGVRREILRFLDAEGAGEKLKVLRELRKGLDEELITTIELSLDLLPDDRESLERRYDLVEKNLEQRIRFEGGRMRLN